MSIKELEVGVDRPKEVALITAIEEVIEEVAAGEMTLVEILGVLSLVSNRAFIEYGGAE